MTITAEPLALSYSGDDSTTEFAITWKYFAKSDVLVTHRDASGVETPWVLDTDYTLTAAGVESGGTLTATTAPATNETLVIELDPPNTQDSSLPLGGEFPSTVVEGGLDQSVQRDVKIQRQFLRSLRVPTTDTQTGDDLDLPIDSLRASKFLAFDANGKPIAAAGTSADLGPVSAFADDLLDNADADTFVQTLVDDLTAEAAPATDDVVLLGDTDEAKGNKMTLANLLKVINALTAETAPAVDDEVLLYDLGAASADKITLANLLKIINALTADATPNQATDYLVTYDADAAAAKKVLIENLFSSGSWTPELWDNSQSGSEGQTYSLQSGYYTKIGQHVFIHGQIIVTGLGTLTGADTAHVGNLPFTNSASLRGGIIATGGSTFSITAGTNVTGIISFSDDAAALNVWSTTGGAQSMTINQFTANGNIIFHGMYKTD